MHVRLVRYLHGLGLKPSELLQHLMQVDWPLGLLLHVDGRPGKSLRWRAGEVLRRRPWELRRRPWLLLLLLLGKMALHGRKMQRLLYEMLLLHLLRRRCMLMLVQLREHRRQVRPWISHGRTKRNCLWVQHGWLLRLRLVEERRLRELRERKGTDRGRAAVGNVLESAFPIWAVVAAQGFLKNMLRWWLRLALRVADLLG